jgi:uncharacterized protein (DUF927 family)
MNRDGSLRATREWCALSLSTGEEKAEDKIKQAGKKANAGTDVRLANVPSMADDSPHGVFDCIHEFHCGKDLSDHLRKTSKQYYGTAIRAFLAEYILHKDAYNETIDAKCREFIKTHLPADAAGQAFSVAHRFALSAVAGELATDFGVVPWDKGFATEAASVCLQAWLGDRGFTGLAETEKLVAYTRKYLGAYQTGRFIDPDCHNHTVPLLTGYKKLEDGRVDFYILPDQLDTIVPGVSEKQWVQAMDKAGFLIREESRATPKYRLRVSHGLERDTEDEGGIGRPPHYIQRHSRVATYRISGSILSGGLPHEEVGAGSVD